MKVPKPLTKLIESFQKLPGIGPKTSQRLSYYLLHVPQEELDSFSDALSKLRKNTVLCSVCNNVSEDNPCPICMDISRDKTTILVVEQPLDVFVFEKTGRYKGCYHVLHGKISPLENIGPDEIYVKDLIKRVESKENAIKEVIIATNPTMEGDATAMYLSGKIKDKNPKLKVSRLGMGIPTGADLQYADDVTLREALEGRRDL